MILRLQQMFCRRRARSLSNVPSIRKSKSTTTRVSPITQLEPQAAQTQSFHRLSQGTSTTQTWQLVSKCMEQSAFTSRPTAPARSVSQLTKKPHTTSATWLKLQVELSFTLNNVSPA